MKHLENTPHLDPLPSSDEGRGNPAVSVKRTPLCVCERSARFPLPFGRGEDQGEGLLCLKYASCPIIAFAQTMKGSKPCGRPCEPGLRRVPEMAESRPPWRKLIQRVLFVLFIAVLSSG